MTDPTTPAPPERPVLGVIPAAMERSIRFLVGIGIMVREIVAFQDPRPWVLLLAATMSGTSLTAAYDEIRRAARGKDPAP